MLAVLGSIGDFGLRDRSSRVADDRRIRLAFFFSHGEDPAVTRPEPVHDNMIPEKRLLFCSLFVLYN